MRLESYVEASVAAARTATVFEGDFYKIDGMSGKAFRFFLNDLIKSLPDPSYLEVGLWGGSTFCSAIAGNAVRAVGIDDWSGIPVSGTDDRPNIVQQIPAPQVEFYNNVSQTESPAAIWIIEQDFHTVDYLKWRPFDVFFYDGPHREVDHCAALGLALPAMRDEFVYVVDDWNWPEVRAGTAAAIAACSLEVAWDVAIRTDTDGSYHAGMELDPWYNGVSIAVLKKTR